MDPGTARGVLAATPGAVRGPPGSKDSNPRPKALRGAGFSAPAGLSAFAATAGEAEAANLSVTPWITAIFAAASSPAEAELFAGTRAAASSAASTFSAVVVIFCHHPRISDFILKLLGTLYSQRPAPALINPVIPSGAEEPHASRRHHRPAHLFHPALLISSANTTLISINVVYR